eukprot:m.457645 g.457645  ORF g.457645 m.457645 type:complete len:1044 (-) comp20334_c0_seq1:1988-5119(-)
MHQPFFAGIFSSTWSTYKDPPKGTRARRLLGQVMLVLVDGVLHASTPYQQVVAWCRLHLAGAWLFATQPGRNKLTETLLVERIALLCAGKLGTLDGQARDTSGRRAASTASSGQRVSALANVGEYSRAYNAMVSLDTFVALTPGTAHVVDQLYTSEPTHSSPTVHELADQAGREAAQLLQQQRQQQQPQSQQHPRPARVQLEPQPLAEAIKKASRASAAGRSGCRLEHLTFLAHVDGGADALASLLSLVVSGKVPAPLSGYLSGGRVTTLLKHKKGTEAEFAADPTASRVRPVVASEPVHRLAASALARQVRMRVSNKCFPYHLGSMPGGTEAFLLSTQASVRRAIHDESPLAVAVVDVRNAFGSVSQQAVKEALQQEGFPDLLPVFEHTYDRKPLLTVQVVGEPAPRARCLTGGLIQGDPLSSAFYQLATLPALRAAAQAGADAASVRCGGVPLEAREHRDLPPVIGAIFDDIKVVGHPGDVAVAVRALREQLALVQLVTAPEKGAWYVASGPPPEDTADLPIHEAGLVDLMGVGLGDDAVLQERWEKRLEQHSDGVDALVSGRGAEVSAQNKVALIRHCLASRFTYTLRVSDPQASAPFCQRVDARTRAAAAAVIGADLLQDDVAWERATLRLADGGLGLVTTTSQQAVAALAALGDYVKMCTARSATVHERDKRNVADMQAEGHHMRTPIDRALLAYDAVAKAGTAAATSTSTTAPTNTSTPLVRDASGSGAGDDSCRAEAPTSFTSVLEMPRPRQRSLSAPLHQVHVATVLRRLTVPQRNRMVNQAVPGAALFLVAIPSVAALRLADPAFRMAVRARLGMSNKELLGCSRMQGCSDYALETDSAAGSFTTRHAHMCSEFKVMLRMAGFQVEAGEPRGAPFPGNTGPDIAVHGLGFKVPTADDDPGRVSPAAGLNSAFLDFTAHHEVAKDDVTLRRALHYANVAHRAKVNRYGNDSRRVGRELVPLVMLSPGGAFHPTLAKFVAHVAKHVDDPGQYRLNWACSDFKSYWCQRLAVSFARLTWHGIAAAARSKQRPRFSAS